MIKSKKKYMGLQKGDTIRTSASIKKNLKIDWIQTTCFYSNGSEKLYKMVQGLLQMKNILNIYKKKKI